MRRHLGPELVEMLSTLAPERREQVLEYARWLRQSSAGSSCGSMDRTAPGDSGIEEGCRPGPASGAGGRELERTILRLNCEQRERVEKYVRALTADPPRGIPGHVLLRFGGTIPESTLLQMEQVIADECERIDYDQW
ncbi:MAG TPA: hypothetical protein VLK84_13610 [Longimicrobium sp.]|nr:hypothetical protein [Longimicrobium sp.]